MKKLIDFYHFEFRESKKIKLYLELFINKKFKYTFVHFISDRSLPKIIDVNKVDLLMQL
jgi:hypothetical protein